MVSEASTRQLEAFLGLVWPIPDNICMVGWLGGHLKPCSTLECVPVCLTKNKIKDL